MQWYAVADAVHGIWGPRCGAYRLLGFAGDHSSAGATGEVVIEPQAVIVDRTLAKLWGGTCKLRIRRHPRTLSRYLKAMMVIVACMFDGDSESKELPAVGSRHA